MSTTHQTWLVARREMRERSRSRSFRVSVVVMLLIVIGVIVVPAMLKNAGTTKKIGLTGSVPATLSAAIQAQGDAANLKPAIHRYDSVAAGRQAVRDGVIDVLVVDAHQLVWLRKSDPQLRAPLTTAIQLVALRERAASSGIGSDTLTALLSPVVVENVELGSVAGRSPDDETAALLMTVLLFVSISTYGALVLSGVVEEKSSRVVEVLLTRMPARNLLAGKVLGIGLLGLAQIAVTAGVALVAMAFVSSIDIPSIGAGVLAWVVVWFVLGYALYAMVYGALGSLASRTEDAQSVAGPVTAVLIAAYFLSFALIAQPDSVLAKVASYFPPTAPLVMPNRIAMGTATWWDPFVAAALTLAAIAALVVVGGRVYAAAILRSGPTATLRDVWRTTHGEPTEPAATHAAPVGAGHRSSAK